MKAGEIHPKKQRYEVGERVLVCPVFPSCSGYLMEHKDSQYSMTHGATVVYVHPQGRFITVEYEIHSAFYGDGVFKIRESFALKGVNKS